MADSTSTSSTTDETTGQVGHGSRPTPRAVGRCSAKTADGRDCPVRPGHGSAYCYLHDPAKREEAQAARRAGGLNAGRPPSDLTLSFKTMTDAVSMLERVASEVAARRLTPPQGTAITHAIRTAIMALKADQEAAISRLEKIMRERGLLRR